MEIVPPENQKTELIMNMVTLVMVNLPALSMNQVEIGVLWTVKQYFLLILMVLLSRIVSEKTALYLFLGTKMEIGQPKLLATQKSCHTEMIKPRLVTIANTRLVTITLGYITKRKHGVGQARSDSMNSPQHVEFDFYSNNENSLH